MLRLIRSFHRLLLFFALITIGMLPSLAAQASPADSSTIIGCKMFPDNNTWNRDISNDPVDPNSANYINSIGTTGKVHPDWGTGWGIPYVVVPGNQPLVPINFTDWPDESDPGPYPIPLNAPIEGNGEGDSHVLVLNSGTCKLYELYVASRNATGWDAACGAVWDFNSNKLRHEGWTSADAAGLPILPGLVRYDEVQAGVITHALRFTVQTTQKKYIHPATHFASNNTSPNVPPMGLRLRLKASFNINSYTGAARVVLTALKKYGMIVADNGSNWFISGAQDSRWNDSEIDQLKNVPGSAF